MTSADPGLLRAIFKRGSRTFYLTSRLFPAAIRRDVEALYAFVRVADDCVDEFPQDARRLDDLQEGFRGSAIVTLPHDDQIVVDAFRELAQRHAFEDAWVDAFFRSMRADLVPKTYRTVDDLLWYIHGSAEVIGLMMARVMRANEDALPAASLLGRAFQYINMLRDIGVDQKLGRTYLSLLSLEAHGLDDLSEQTARANPDAFSALVREELDRYRAWQREAEEGIAALPRRCRPAVRAAAAAYLKTADHIERDPLSVYDGAYKPSRAYLALRLVVAALT